MSNDIQRAKEKFPLPQVMRHFGFGDRAKRSSISPFRDEKSPSFGIFQKDGGEWNWKDLATGEFGDEIDFITKLKGISPEDARKEYLELSGVHRESHRPVENTVLKGRKLRRIGEAMREESPKSFDWEACVSDFEFNSEEIASWRGYSVEFVDCLRSNKLIGMHKGRVAIPVRDITSNEVIGCHCREKDGSWRFEPKGIQNSPFVMGNPISAKETLVFESQWDALAVADKLGWHEGRIDEVAFIATRGAANGKLVAGLLGKDSRVVAFPQNDKPKADGKIPAEEWLKGVIEAAGEHAVYRAETPSEHKDANDWVKAGVDDKTLLETISKAKRYRATSKLPEMRDLSTIIGEKLPPKPPELVKGLLHQGSKLIIGGTSKGRKTFSLLDLAISVQAGAKWWGHETIQGRVCYINFEIQEPFFAQRIQDIAAAKKVPINPGMLMGWTLRGHVEGIEKMSAEITDYLLNENFSLIIFDPIYKALGDRDENKAGDVASMLNELESIAVKTGAAIAFGAHYSKGNQSGKESIDRIGGSGVFARDPDSILTMTAHEQEECFTVEATLRNFKPVDPFVIRWEWPVMWRADDLDPSQLKQTAGGGRPKKTNDDAIIEALDVPMTFAEWHKKLDPEIYSRDTFKNAVRRLSQANFIRKNERGHWVKVVRRWS